MAESVVDHIQRLRCEIDEYIGLRSAVSELAEFWMRLEGPEIEPGDAPTSIITAMLDTLRVGVQTVAEYLERGSITARPTAELKQACDLRVVAWVPGSIQVGLRLPEMVSLGLEEGSPRTHVRQALGLYLRAAVWAGSEDDTSELEQELPEPEQRRLLLSQVSRLIPRPRGDLDLVELFGREVPRGPVRMHRGTREKVQQAISKTLEEDTIRAEGVVREIDLDQRSFIIRDPRVDSETRCAISPEFDDLLEIAKHAVDHRVVVTGKRQRDPTRRISFPLQVREIEVLGTSAEEPVTPVGA
jgi:hypothetical protein